MTRTPTTRRFGAAASAALLAAVPLAFAAPAAYAETYPDTPIVFNAAFSGDEAANLYALDVADGAARKLTDNAFEEDQAAWSPDGSEILFRSNEWGPHNLYLVGADGGEPEPVTADTGGQSYPTWSPDGQRIAYEYHSALRPPETTGIYTNTPEGGDPVQLTVGGRQPDWDPREEWIAYVHHEGAHDTWTIMWVSPDGSDSADVVSRHEWEITGPEWSPDGEYLAFREQHIVNDTVIVNVMHRDTRETYEIVAAHGGIWNPTWSPDGEWLAYTSIWPDGRGIYVVNVADPANPGEPEKVLDIPDPQWPDLDWAAN